MGTVVDCVSTILVIKVCVQKPYEDPTDCCHRIAFYPVVWDGRWPPTCISTTRPASFLPPTKGSMLIVAPAGLSLFAFMLCANSLSIISLLQSWVHNLVPSFAPDFQPSQVRSCKDFASHLSCSCPIVLCVTSNFLLLVGVILIGW